MNRVWVLAHDYGYEGLAEAFLAFETRAEAERMQKMLSDEGYATVRLSEVPIWGKEAGGVEFASESMLLNWPWDVKSCWAFPPDPDAP